jgi:hypothetical protein
MAVVPVIKTARSISGALCHLQAATSVTTTPVAVTHNGIRRVSASTMPAARATSADTIGIERNLRIILSKGEDIVIF